MPLNAPTNLLPTDHAYGVEINATLGWGYVSDAVSYDVEVSRDNSFVWGVISMNTTNLYVTTETLLFSAVYYWRVRSRGASSVGSWSTVQWFQTRDLIPADIPPLKIPLNGAVNLPQSPLLEWYATSRTTSYEIDYSTDALFIYFAGRLTSAGTSIQLTGLALSTTYYWRVRAVGVDEKSGYSPVWSFTTTGSTSFGDTNKGIGGVLTMSGDLSMVIITGSGTVVNKTLNGEITPRGGLGAAGYFRAVTTLVKNLGGTLSFTGGLFRGNSVFLSGAINFTGTTLLTIGLSFAGSIAMAGSTALTIGKNLGGTLRLAGKMFTTRPMRLSGRISMNGNTYKTIPKILSGAVSMTGSTVKTITVFLSGVISLTKSFSNRVHAMEATAFNFTTRILKNAFKTQKWRS